MKAGSRTMMLFDDSPIFLWQGGMSIVFNVLIVAFCQWQKLSMYVRDVLLSNVQAAMDQASLLYIVKKSNTGFRLRLISQCMHLLTPFRSLLSRARLYVETRLSGRSPLN